MKLRYGMFNRTGKVVSAEALEGGGRKITVKLDSGKPDTATIELELEDLRVMVGPPAGGTS